MKRSPLLCRIFGHNWRTFDRNWCGVDYRCCWRWGCRAYDSIATADNRSGK